jgi:hypothetical protein
MDVLSRGAVRAGVIVQLHSLKRRPDRLQNRGGADPGISPDGPSCSASKTRTREISGNTLGTSASLSRPDSPTVRWRRESDALVVGSSWRSDSGGTSRIALVVVHCRYRHRVICSTLGDHGVKMLGDSAAGFARRWDCRPCIGAMWRPGGGWRGGGGGGAGGGGMAGARGRWGPGGGGRGRGRGGNAALADGGRSSPGAVEGQSPSAGMFGH